MSAPASDGPLSRERQIQGAAVALKALLSGHDPVQPPEPVPAHETTGRGTRGGTKLGPSPGFLAHLSISVFFACLAWFAAGSSGGRFVTPQGTQPGFRSQADGSGAIQNRPAGPEQDVMRFDARSFAVVMASGLSGSTLAQAPVEWKVSAGGNGHWYYAVSGDGRCWSQQRDAAIKSGGYLASISSQQENAFISSRLVSLSVDPGAFYNVGGLQSPNSSGRSSGWGWVTGEAWDYSAWAGGQPDDFPEEQNRLAITSEGWHDGTECPPYTGSGYVIEWSADCNNDGIVDYGQIRDEELADYNGNNIPDCCERNEPCTIFDFPVEWKVSAGGNGHWYKTQRFDSTVAWEAARVSAVQQGGHLATVNRDGEHDFLHALSLKQDGWSGLFGPWLGGYSEAGLSECEDASWRWITGEPWDTGLSKWCFSQPDCGGEQRLHLWGGCSSGWNNAAESGEYGWGSVKSFMIEWSADCDADGMVDYGQILRGDQLDRDQNGVPDSCQCATNASLAICCTSDLDLDGEVGASDISVLLLSFGDPRWMAPALDLDGDGEIGGGDLSFVLLDLGPCR